MGNSPPISQPSECIREFTPERNPMNGVDVAKPTIGCGLSLNIRKYTQGRNPMKVINARELFATSQTSFYIRKLIRGKCQRSNDQQSNKSHNLQNAKAL